MNKQNVKRALGVFALSLAVFGAALPSAKVTASAAITETNGCYTMVAAGTETADGVTVAYFNNSSDFIFEFDLIKAPKYGEMGFINAKKSELDLTADDFGGADYFFIGEEDSSASFEISELETFVAGYRYRMEMDRSDGMLRLSKKSYRNASSKYENVGNHPIKVQNMTMFGLAVRSDGEDSAWALIDNCLVSMQSGDRKESFETNPAGIFSMSSNENGYAELYKGETYTVVFMDHNGSVLKTVYAKEYTSLVCEAPESKGMVHVGWSEDVTCIRKDMIVTPVYEKAPEKEDSSVPDVSSDNDTSSENNTAGGFDCNSTLTLSGAFSVLPILAIGAWILQKGGKEE